MNKASLKNNLILLVAIGLLCLIAWALYWTVTSFFELVSALDPIIGLGIVTAAGTIIVSTITVVLGRYLERRKEIDSHFRESKINIYDEFLKEFFNLFYAEDNNSSSKDSDLVEFLREWQRKIILWGGQDVVKSYIEWIDHLKTGEPDAKAMFLTEDFFRAIRKDVGHQNWKLARGSFTRLILKHPELFLKAAKANPNITLAEIAELEESLTTDDES